LSASRRELAKDPAERYGSTRDLYLELRTMQDHISEVTASGVTAPVYTGRKRGLKTATVALGASLLVLAALFSGIRWGPLTRTPRDDVHMPDPRHWREW
jgi:hypothetical protein